MQTFLPYSDFHSSAQVLDWRRLGKQRVESRQILKSLQFGNGWKHHPAVKMWKGYEEALKLYSNIMIEEWIRRGKNNNMEILPIISPIKYPWWFGYDLFHASHRSNLLRKFDEHYSQFGWKETKDMPYFWPVQQ